MQTLEITSPDQLWTWLAENHGTRESVRLVTWKAADRDKYVGREEVLDALIAHGWIDGRRFAVDDSRTAQLVSPRRQQAWSKSYKDRADREAAIEEGRASGLWNFYDDVDALVVPSDLGSVLDLKKWNALAPSYQRNVLRWIKLAKTPQTRINRINAVADATREKRKLPQM